MASSASGLSLTYIEPELLSDFNPDRDPFEVERSHNRELAGRSSVSSRSTSGGGS